MFQMNNVGKTKKTYFIFSKFFSENHAVYVTNWKNMVQPDRPQTSQYGASALHAG